MIPQGGLPPNADTTESEPSRTYKLNYADGRVVDYTDGLDAIKQAVYKVMNTDQFSHTIYGAGYGLEKLIGVDRGTLEIELPQLIEEALTQDDRITAVTDFEFEFSSDEVRVSFTVESEYGKFNYSQEVRNGV